MNTHYQLVANAEELQRAVDELSTKHAIGLDTETTDLDPYTARLRLIQLATPDGVRIVDVHRFNEDMKRSEAFASLRQMRGARCRGADSAARQVDRADQIARLDSMRPT